jgi:hypothetical protein
VNLVAFVPIFLQWVGSEERAAVRIDARAVRDEAAAAAAAASQDGPLAPAHPRPLTLWEEQWLARRGVVPTSGTSAASPPVPGRT